MANDQSSGATGRNLLIGELIVIGGLATWLFTAALIVDIEPYDGFDVICNSRCLLGLTDRYAFVRMPLMPLVMTPAEYIKESAGMHPMEVRPHHITMALLHCVYLAVVYAGIIRVTGRRWSTLAAFAITIPCVVFFIYAPFINHDILPGAILLWMLLLARRIAKGDAGWKTWSFLIALGAAAPLIKYTYAVYWFIILIVFGLLALPWIAAEHRTPRKVLLPLFGGAVTSAVVFWLVSAWALGSWIPDEPFLMRPMVQLNDYLNQSQSQGAPWWLYFRNAWAYGVAALLLLVPGIAIAWRRSTTHRAIAMAWVIALIAMQCVAMKEVRYLVFLTPLSAILIAPAIQWLGTPGRRWMLTLPAVALCVDLMHVAPEAALIKSPFYRQSECRQLLSPLEMAGGKRKPVLASYRYLSFATPEHSPFVGDRYHRIFHFEIDHIQALYGYKKGEVILFDPKKVPLIVNDFRDNTPLLFANHLLLNSLGWEHRAPLGKDTFFQCIAFARTITLTRDARGALVTPEGVSLELYPGTVDERPAMMFGSPLQRELGRLVMPVMVDVDTNQAWPIRRVSKGTYAVTPGSETDLNKSRQITIRGFEIAFYIQYK